MSTFKDFKNGLQSATDYLEAKHHLSGTTALGNSALNVVAQAEYSFTLKELLCGVLSGNGVKLPNLQICMSANIAALLNIPGLQSELADALTQLDSAMNDFMDHTKLDSVLGRLNGVLAEAQNVANMINFCSAPVDPIAIPNMLERAFGSFLGAGKNLIDQIGSIAPENVCACVGSNGFNGNVFNGGILKTIADNISDINAGTLSDAVIGSIRNDINSVKNNIDNLISFENNIKGAYSLGGSQFATPDSGCNSEIGVMHNPFNGSIADNARLATSMKALYDRLAGYPVTYRPGTVKGGTDGGNGNAPLSSSDPTNSDGTVRDTTPVEYENIFKLLFDDEFLNLLEKMDDPQSTVDTQIPVRDYCGNIIGYTTNYVQQQQQTSDGTTPTKPNSPGYAAGGLNTSNGAGTENTETVSGGSITVSGGGSNVYLVNSEAAQLALTPNTHDIAVRTDILTVFVRKDTTSFNTGTMSDYQQSSVTLTAFGNSVNDLTSYGFVVKDGNTAISRSILGTTNEITVTNGNGAGGNPTVGLADNTVIPGNQSVTIPVGSSSQRPGTGNSGMIRYNTNLNVIEAYFTDSAAWEPLLTTTSNTNTQAVNNINVGTGARSFKQYNASQEYEFRSITANGGITVTENTNEIVIGETITGSNLGTGAEIFSSRVTNDLQFRTLTSSYGTINITQNTNDVDINQKNTYYTTLQTTNNTTVDVTFNSNVIQPATDRSWFFKLYVLAGDTGTTRRAWELQGVVQNNNGVASLVGAVSKNDYQRGTQDMTPSPWSAGAEYQSMEIVEYDLITYTANTNISAGSASSYLSPDQNTDWTVTYTGWNASALTSNNNFVIRVRGDTNTVNWSVKLEYVEL